MESLMNPQAIMYIVGISLAVFCCAKAVQRLKEKKAARARE